jgi:ribosomal protein S17E
MVCPKCGHETKGIKLNGKLFCSFCGEVIKDSTEILEESYQSTPVYAASAPIELTKPISDYEAKVISPDEHVNTVTPVSENPLSEKKIDFLKAEEEIVDLIEQAEPEIASQAEVSVDIKKHQRPRTDHRDTDFELVENEPNPVAEPELESPHDMLVEDVEPEEAILAEPILEQIPEVPDTDKLNTTPETKPEEILPAEVAEQITELPMEQPFEIPAKKDELTTESVPEPEIGESNSDEKKLKTEIPVESETPAYTPAAQPEKEEVSGEEAELTENETNPGIEPKPELPDNKEKTEEEPEVEVITEPEAESLNDRVETEEEPGAEVTAEPEPKKSEPTVEATPEVAADEAPLNDKELEELLKPVDYSLSDDVIQEEAPKKTKKWRNALSGYLMQTVGSNKPKPKKKEKRKKRGKKKKNRLIFPKWLLIIPAIIITLAALTGLVFYVNKVAIDPIKIQEELESKTNFVYEKPASVPEGYQLSYQSSSGEDSITYYYTFTGKRDRYLSIKIETTEIKPDEVLEKVIDKETEFSQISEGSLEFWQTKNHKIYVIKDSLLYTFSNSGEIIDGNFLIFAKETLI